MQLASALLVPDEVHNMRRTSFELVLQGFG